MKKLRTNLAGIVSRLSTVVAIAVPVLASGGCSDGRPYAVVSGTVTLDGSPIERGSLRLIPIDGRAPTAGAAIQGGHYRQRIVQGQYRVEINAPKRRGSIAASQDATTADEPLPPELVPAKYNLNSELCIDVDQEEKAADFELSTR